MRINWVIFGIGLFFIIASLNTHSGVIAIHDEKKRLTGLYMGPYFDTSVSTNITAQLGTHAYLPCKVKQLGNKSVSWVRSRDSHILTVDRYAFIADERFQTFLVDSTDTWTLQIKYVQARDAGTYECQVSTEPKMSHVINLMVVVPHVQIIGDMDLHVKVGSSIDIKCVITQSIEEPAYIFWYHDNQRILDYDHSLRKIKKERLDSETTLGTLTIFQAKIEDAGNYTCNPSNLASTSVLLHVLNGEHPAAMQRGKNAASPMPCRWWGPLSAGLGFSTCLSPKNALTAILVIEVVSHIGFCIFI